MSGAVLGVVSVLRVHTPVERQTCKQLRILTCPRWEMAICAGHSEDTEEGSGQLYLGWQVTTWLLEKMSLKGDR